MLYFFKYAFFSITLEIENLHNNFPKSRLVEVSNAGHWVHAENLNDFAEETLYFLKS